MFWVSSVFVLCSFAKGFILGLLGFIQGFLGVCSGSGFLGGSFRVCRRFIQSSFNVLGVFRSLYGLSLGLFGFVGEQLG